jgi:glycosyltransferase involved in cell wall biosynthesis
MMGFCERLNTSGMKSPKVSVIHIITTIAMGGAEKQLLTLVREQVKDNRAVTVVYLKSAPELKQEFIDAGARVEEFLAQKNFLLQILLLRNFLHKNRDSVVHAHLPKAELVTILSSNSKKVILSRHNAEKFFPSAPDFVSKFLSKLVTFRAAEIIAISEAVSEFLIDSKEIKKGRTPSVVLYGIDPIINLSILRKNSVPYSIGTIARLVPQKDLQVLCKAFSVIITKIPAATLYIVGDGPLKNELQTLCEELKVSHAVHWLGRTDKVEDFLFSIETFVLTSRYEGFGLVLLEALRAGLPVVAANNSAIPEVLGSNHSGLCETGNVQMFAQRILDTFNPEMRKHSIDQGQQRLEMFSALGMNRKMNEVYLRVEKLIN